MRRRVSDRASERASPLTNEPEDNVIITRLSGGAERRDPGIFQHTHAGIPFSALSPLSLGDDRKTEEPSPLRRTSPSVVSKAAPGYVLRKRKSTGTAPQSHSHDPLSAAILPPPPLPPYPSLGVPVKLSKVFPWESSESHARREPRRQRRIDRPSAVRSLSEMRNVSGTTRPCVVARPAAD